MPYCIVCTPMINFSFYKTTNTKKKNHKPKSLVSWSYSQYTHITAPHEERTLIATFNHPLTFSTTQRTVLVILKEDGVDLGHRHAAVSVHVLGEEHVVGRGVVRLQGRHVQTETHPTSWVCVPGCVSERAVCWWVVVLVGGWSGDLGCLR